LLGNKESLTTVELQEVMEQQRVVFVPTGSTLLVVGDVQPDATLASVRKWLGNWQGWKDINPMPQVAPPALPGVSEEVGFLERHAASTLLTCAMRPLPEVAGDDPALRVLVFVLGGGLKSRLVTTLREENGFTYVAGAEILRRRQANALVACAPLQGETAEKGVQLFRGVLQGLRDSPPTESEVGRAKARCVAEIESAEDDAMGITAQWLRALTLGYDRPHPDQERAAIEKVSLASVQKLARSIFRVNRFRWVVSGDAAVAKHAFAKSMRGKLKPFLPGE
jgi:predicted Zn-dependent peptidase